MHVSEEPNDQTIHEKKQEIGLWLVLGSAKLRDKNLACSKGWSTAAFLLGGGFGLTPHKAEGEPDPPRKKRLEKKKTTSNSQTPI